MTKRDEPLGEFPPNLSFSHTATVTVTVSTTPKLCQHWWVTEVQADPRNEEFIRNRVRVPLWYVINAADIFCELCGAKP